MSHAMPETAALPAQLRSNSRPLSTAPERLGRLPALDGSAPVAAIREAFVEHGALRLRSLLPHREVLDLRRRFFGLLAEAGILEPGTDPVDGIGRADPGDEALARKLLMSFVRSARYEAFCLHPKLVELMDGFLDGLSYLHKRKIIRHTRAGSSATPAHYDLIYLRAGTDRVVTLWIPIGDVPVEMGGLAYLEGSDRVGRRLEAEFAEKNADLSPEERINAYNRNMAEGGWLTRDLAGLAERFDTRWLVSDYEAGDVVLHSAYTIHAATDNESPERRMRLSSDIRYQRVSDEIDIRWANHWSLDDML